MLYGSSQAVINLVVNSTSFTYSFRLRRNMPEVLVESDHIFALSGQIQRGILSVALAEVVLLPSPKC